MANNARPRPQSGAGYLFQGFSLMMAPGLRRFVIIPILINVLLLGGAFIYLLSQVGDWIDHWMASLPEWLSWLSFLIWPLVVVAILVVFSYVFSTLANWIAAPFNGLLAEHVEAKLSGTRAPDDGLAGIIKDIPRVMKREWQKLAYYIPRAIGFLLLLWIPAVGQTVGPVIWFLFSAWMMAIQYCDYPFDNHKVSFPAMRQTLNQQRGASLGFGAVVMLFTMTPFLNLLVMPAAVCGATAMWVDKHKASLGRN